MKKRFKNSLTVLVVVLLVQSGCKSGSSGTPLPLPNIADFMVTSSSGFAAGNSSTVSVYCSSIGSGTYYVHFDLAGADTGSSLTSTLVMSNNTGSFKTPALPNPGPVFLTLNSITNINGGGTAFNSNNHNNTYTISDSTGSMAAIIGGATTFNAVNVLATITGTKLTIRGEVDEPGLTTITIYIDSFTQQTGAIVFSSYNVPEIAGAMYTSGSETHGGTLSANGTINIVSLSPLIAGTFSFTGMDSTHITNGSFSTIAPSN